MSGIIISEGTSLPRDIDVAVNVSKPQFEAATDLSIAVFCTKDAPFDHDASRVQYFTTLDAVTDVFATSSEAYKAALAWFSQSPRAKTLAIGKIFTTPQAGFLQTKPSNVDASWKAVTDGTFAITIDGVSANVTGVSFATINELADVAAILQAAIRSANAAEGFAQAIVLIDENKLTLRITSGTTGETSLVSRLSPVSPASGTDISGSDFLNGAYIEDSAVQNSYTVPGYTPGDIASELAYIQEAATAGKKFLYGWALEASYRDTNDIITAAEWIEGQTAALFGVVTNSPFAYDPSSITDVGYLLNKAGYRRSFCVFHNNPYYYPELSIMAYALSVNYAAYRSTITTKFKVLQGIPTVPITVSELFVLNGKRINTYTAVGNTARTFREGTESDPNWFIDDLTNLDNFREELQTAVFNVFLRNKKVPYTVDGIALIHAAIQSICDRYVYNGAFSERPLSDADALALGYPIDPAYTITFTPIGMMTVSERAQRIGPPATVKVNLAGAIHSITINVEAYS